MIPFMRRDSNICPYSSAAWMTAPVTIINLGWLPRKDGSWSMAFSAVRLLAARCPTANESFRNWIISALVFSSSGPLEPLMFSGIFSPVTRLQKKKLAAPVCFSNSAKVRTSLYAAPGMLSDAGVKLYLSSGMASATSSKFCSYWLTWRSAMAERLVMGGGVGWAWAAVNADGDGVAGFAAPWAKAPMAKLRIAGRHSILRNFMAKSPLVLVTKKDTT